MTVDKNIFLLDVSKYELLLRSSKKQPFILNNTIIFPSLIIVANAKWNARGNHLDNN